MAPLSIQEMGQYVVNLRTYSITRNVWVKDSQPLRSLIVALQKEKYLSKNALLIHYSMIRDACTLLAYRVKFTDRASTKEIRRQKVELDICKLLGPKKYIPEADQHLLLKAGEEIETDIVQMHNNKKFNDHQEKTEVPFGQVLKPGGIREGVQEGLRDKHKNEINLARILYQMVISLNPMQTATILYNDVIDEFTYRIYRPQDGSVYEKSLSSENVTINCHPVYKSCILQKKHMEVGERIAKHYMNEMMIESVLEFSSLI